MLQILYIFAFTLLSLVAAISLVRNMLAFAQSEAKLQNRHAIARRPIHVPHPELLDEHGNLIHEPLLVMRSMDVDEARSRLDALYEASPSGENS